MSNQYPPPQPPPPGFGPPPQPKKSATGLVLGLVFGVVLLVGLVGGGLWFFGGGGAGLGSQKTKAFLDEYDPVVEAVAAGTQFSVDHPDSYDICDDLEMTALTKMLPFEEGPSGGTSTSDSGTGAFGCAGRMRGEIEVDNNNPTGSMSVVFEVMNTSDMVEESYDALWDSKLNRYTKPLGEVKIGDEAEARYLAQNDGVGVGIAFRNGNLRGYLTLGMTQGRYYEPPDKQMMVNLMVDIANSGMATLNQD